MKKDIVCEMMVDETTSLATTYGERQYHFCSETCQRNFALNPLRYVDKSHSAASTAGAATLSASGKKEHSNW